VLYVIGCLGIVFYLLPSLWWPVWEGLDLARYQFVGGSILGILMLAAGVGLLYVGSRLMGPRAPVGIRAGVFVGLVGLLLVVLLTRWASLWIEHWVYVDRWFGDTGPSTGRIVVGVVGVVLLLGFVWLFTRPRTQRSIIVLEEGGWFSATAYKSNQGLRVRRATIAGILLLVGAGIYTLISHGSLRKGSPNLEVALPFTGAVAVESYGDTQAWIADLPDTSKTRVQIRFPGKSGWQEKQTVSTGDYRDKVLATLSSAEVPGDVKDRLTKAANGEISQFLVAVNKEVYSEIGREKSKLRPEARRRVDEVSAGTTWSDITPAIKEFEREIEQARKTSEQSGLFELPTAVVVIDRYTLRDINDKADPQANVRVGLNPDSDVIRLQEGSIVSTSTFDEAVSEGKKKRKSAQAPDKIELNPATGTQEFSALTLLPSIQFTVPLLLLALSMWLAWRIVNMPTFADFLIATEAELNKVSWTTQKRLIQDTIVVLATVVLMAVYLFLMDQGWRVLLSSRLIGVLHLPKDQVEAKQTIEQKRW